jgi:hypothetical protein
VTREQRANFIFACALAVLIAPGFFLLMRKKLTGSDRPNFLPEPVPHQVAYIQPDPVPPNLPRVEPTEVKQWVDTLIRERGIKPLRGTGGTPILSNDHRVQMLGEKAAGAAMQIALLLWKDSPLGNDEPELTASDDTPAAVVANTPIDVPTPIRHALQEAGYVNPPTRVWLIERSFASVPRSQLRLRYPSGTLPVQTIRLMRDEAIAPVR